MLSNLYRRLTGKVKVVETQILPYRHVEPRTSMIRPFKVPLLKVGDLIYLEMFEDNFINVCRNCRKVKDFRLNYHSIREFIKTIQPDAKVETYLQVFKNEVRMDVTIFYTIEQRQLNTHLSMSFNERTRIVNINRVVKLADDTHAVGE